jgi:hypothetical protein
MAEPFGPPRSIRFFPSMSGTSGVEGNEFIFTRDLPIGVMPIRGIRGSEDYRAALDPPDDAVADRIVRLLDVGRFPRHGLAEALGEFVETTTRYLGYRGEVIYEIATTPDDDTGAAELRLIPLPPGRVIRTPWGFYQVIPKADRHQRGKGWTVRIPRSKLWRMTLPHRLGGVRRHRRMLKMLRTRASPTPGLTLGRMDMGRGIGYDFSAHHRACSIGTERATRRWGTMPSFFRVEGTTEYFSFSRRLDFKRSQAELRDHVIEQLNLFLGRLGFRHRIAVEGLVSPAEISEMMRRLQTGEVTVSEALDVDRP